MILREPAPLLAADEPPACSMTRADGRSPFALICDHASRRIPRALGDLGVPERELRRHIAWDIGAAAVATILSQRLDALLIAQNYSRLVIDCNRPLGSPGSIVARSEHTDIPGNIGVEPDAAAARAAAIFTPYHACIERELERREGGGRASMLVSVHSFTPVYAGVARPWQLGTLYGADARLAHALIALVRSEGRWNIGDNEPYAVSATTDYAIPVHGVARGIPNVGIELRQDLIETPEGQAEWGERIAGWLQRVAAEVVG